jgi:hypothetical protein
MLQKVDACRTLILKTEVKGTQKDVEDVSIAL